MTPTLMRSGCWLNSPFMFTTMSYGIVVEEFVWFLHFGFLILFDGITSSNDVFQLCFESKCTT